MAAEAEAARLEAAKAKANKKKKAQSKKKPAPVASKDAEANRVPNGMVRITHNPLVSVVRSFSSFRIDLSVDLDQFCCHHPIVWSIGA